MTYTDHRSTGNRSATPTGSAARARRIILLITTCDAAPRIQILAAYFAADAALRPIVRSGVGLQNSHAIVNASNAPAVPAQSRPGTWLVTYHTLFSSILADQLNIHSADVAVTVHAAPRAGIRMAFSKIGASCLACENYTAGR